MTDIAAGQCQNFVASADGYDRLMGRYLPSLAPAFADAAGVQMRDGPDPVSASIRSFSRLTNAAGSSIWPPSASVA